jgi:transitional endoplasmic reticulum ATPase
MSLDPVRSLQDALQFSPDNIPLRRHLVRTLMGLGRWDEAERECRTALSMAAADRQIKYDLAEIYAQQGKPSQSLVILEDMVRSDEGPAAAHVLYARLLLAAGDVQHAVAQYKLGIERDPAAADMELAERLGVTIDPDESQSEELFEGRLRASQQQGPSGREAELERPKLRFQDVGGMESVKEEIGMKILYPLKHPEMFRAYGKTVGGGILMYGPPGCGKTYLARATAGEIDASFLAVGISDVLDMWIGSSERNLRGLFEQARYNKPCVLFFDEVDALGGKRADMSGGSARQLINQFLAELDGVASSNDGVLVLAATNAPWHVDAAFRRPGRFDRILFIPPPDLAARASILRLHCAGKPIERIDFDQLAKMTDGFSGADLKAVVDIGVESKLREALRAGALQPLTTKDLSAAAKTHKPTTREWFSTARNYALYANQAGLYDDVVKFLKM